MDVVDGKTQVTNGDLYSTKPGTLAGRYLRRFWQPLGRSQDVHVGRAYTTKIMSELVTVYRGENGRVHVVQSHCPHRATLLSTGWVEGDALRCHYHGWKYDETGQCIEQPGEDAGFAAKICLRTYPAQDYLGLVFAYLGEGEAPPIRRFTDFEEPGVVEVPALIEFWPCNLFNRIDNAGDPGHIAYTHKESLRRNTGFKLAPPNCSVEETEYGTRAFEQLADGTTIYPSHFHMPNINQVGARAQFKTASGEMKFVTGERLFFRVPVDDEHSVSYTVEYFPLEPEDASAYLATRSERQDQRIAELRAHSEAILRNETTVEDADPTFTTQQMFWIEDYMVQVGQLPISDDREEHLGRTDVGIILIRKLWRRELQALADGRPLQNWTAPAGLNALGLTGGTK
jgi:5,5'-dehydrodivanillate O-demethylase